MTDLLTRVHCVLRHSGDGPLADPGLLVCPAHLSGMSDRIAEVRALFECLDELATPGPSTDENRRGKSGLGSKPPMRLDVLVLRDVTREAAADGVYPISTVTRWAERVRIERGLQRIPRDHVPALLSRLRLHLRWVGAADWVEEFDTDLRRVLGSLGRAAGDIARPHVGTCPVLDEDGAECGGKLIADKFGALGAGCIECGARWSEGDLMRLGQILAEQQAGDSE